MDIPKGKEMGPEKKNVLGFDFVLVCFLFLLVLTIISLANQMGREGDTVRETSGLS